MAVSWDLTRRSMLAGMMASVTRLFPPERVRYADPATEFWVLRLTSPEHSSSLPLPPLRAVARRRGFLIYANDRTGSPQLFQMLSVTGESRQLTTAAALDPLAFALANDDRAIFFFDGASFRELRFANRREREIYRVPDGWLRRPGLALTANGSAVFSETDGARFRVRAIPLGPPAREPATLLETAEPLDDPQPRPAHDGVLFRRGGALWVDGRRLPLASGATGQAFWTADGERAVYLNLAPPGRLNSIREFAVDANADRLVTPTSQFVSFAPNPDASVFVGASANKASPHILLLLRSSHRELTLCEHKASDPARAYPIFSPDSQRVYFQSDRHGKPALYSIAVDRLVERTD